MNMGIPKGYMEIADVGGKNPFRKRRRKRKMEQGDRVIYTLYHGKMTRVASTKGPTNLANFLIICSYGDWSGFRTLEGCEKQFPELEETAKENGRDDHFYQVVERW